MYKQDINAHFTGIVREYMDKGFIVNAQTMSSLSTDEVCKVDLTDGKDIYRILLEEIHKHYDEYDDEGMFLYVDNFRLTVRKYSGRKLHTRLTWSLFNSDGEVIREENFYRMPNRSNHKTERDNWYTSDFNAVVCAERVHRYRCDAKRIPFLFGDFYQYPESAKRKILPLIRRLPRCKTAHLEDVGAVWRNRHEDGRSVINIYVRGNHHAMYLGKEKSA